MLGIRRVGNVAVDLWQGDPSDFVCDVTLSVDSILHLRSQLWQLDAKSGCQHLVILPHSSKDAVEFVQAVEALESHLELAAVERITFILGDLASYKVFQDALMAD